MSNNLLTEELAATLDGATSATIEIDSGSGNLSIDELADARQTLATGTLQYFEKQGRPSESVSAENGHATLTVKGTDSGRQWFHFPWSACNGATDWQIHLNAAISSEISARTGGGNVKLDLAHMALTRLSADTGGGNMEVVLPDHAANLQVAARTGAGSLVVKIGEGTAGSNAIDAHSGAGNVVIKVPHGMAVSVHAKSGLGKVLLDPPLRKIDGHTYQSEDYDNASDRAEITVSSGAGNVSVIPTD